MLFTLLLKIFQLWSSGGLFVRPPPLCVGGRRQGVCFKYFLTFWYTRYPKLIRNIPCLHPAAAAAAKLLQLCPTLCDPIDSSPIGSPVPGILQARTLEWVAISFSNAWKWKVKVKSLSLVRPSATPWTAAHQALRPWDFLGKSTGVGCHCLLQNWTIKYQKLTIKL